MSVNATGAIADHDKKNDLRQVVKPTFATLLIAIPLLQTEAAEEQLLSESSWLTDIPKVVFATRQQQDLTSAPSSVTVINREMIAAMGVFNLADIFTLVPGFQVFHSNGSTFGVTPHGFSNRYPRRLEVRVNDRSVYLPQFASVAWESLGVLPEDIDHIEVIRGSNVPSYGSNAVMGAINIVTRNALQQHGGGVKITSGSAGTGLINANQVISTDSADIMLRAAYKTSNGFKGLEDDGDIGHLVISSIYTPGLYDTLDLELGLTRGEVGWGDGDHPDEFADDKRRANWINGQWQRQLDSQMFRVRFSYTDYHFERSFAPNLSEVLDVPAEVIPLLIPGQVDHGIELGEGNRHFHVADVEFEHHLELGEHKLLWGLGGRQDQLDSQELVGGEVDTKVYYLFSNYQWQVSSDAEFNLGFMVEDKEGFDAEVSPRIALNYHLNSSHHLRVSATRAYRQPALLESDLLWTARLSDGSLLDLIQISSPDIESARVDTVELGYIGYWFDGRLGLDLKLFREEVTDEIDGFDVREEDCLEPTPDQQPFAEQFCPSFFVNGEYGAPLEKRVRVFDNVANWDMDGIEAQLSWKASEKAWLRANYAYLSGEGQRARALHFAPIIRPIVDNQPRHSGSILFSYQAPRDYQLSFHWSYVGFIDWRSGTDVDSHDRLDFKTEKTVSLGSGEAQLSLVVQNLLDEEYLEFQNGNEFGRRAFVSLKYNWPE